MKTAFNHENLKVYQNALQFAAKSESWIVEWDKKHAIYDHLPRAAGSIAENIATASAAYSGMKTKGLDYALGSTLECAACLDIANIKRLMENQCVIQQKRELLQMFKMLVGLRHSWSPPMAKESHARYGSDTDSLEDDKVHDKKIQGFHHEYLDVYRVALEIVVLLSTSPALKNLSNRVFRGLDALLTSVVLNIAEGNGRFSKADQRRFLDISHTSAIKMVAKLDICVIQNTFPAAEVEKYKRLLSKVARMTGGIKT